MASFLRVLVRAHHGDLLQIVEFRDVTPQLTVGDVRDRISSAFPTIDNFGTLFFIAHLFLNSIFITKY